jgi:hypothetical protein
MGPALLDERDLKEYGYAVLRGFVRPEQLAEMRAEAAAALEMSRRAARDPQPWAIAPMDSHLTPAHRAVMGDIRLKRCAELLIARPTMAVRIEASERTGCLGWHTDIDSTEPVLNGVNMIVYFDRLGPQNGALRVSPGSHAGPLGEALLELQRHREVAALALPHVVLNTNPGDVVIFSMRLWHASFGGGVRQFAMASYWPVPSTEPERELFRTEFARIRIKLLKHFGYPLDRPIRALNLASTTSSPRSDMDNLLGTLGWS